MPINLNNLTTLKQTNVFVETGSLFGDGVQLALDSGFERVMSIECNRNYYEQCLARFADNKRVQMYYGDSAVDLAKVISNIDEPITFWLDAHYMWNDPSQNINEHPGRGKIPLIDELQQIKDHPIKNHVIMVDDLSSLSNLNPRGDKPPTGTEDTKVENLKRFISTINENYTFEIHEGVGDSFLVCRVL